VVLNSVYIFVIVILLICILAIWYFLRDNWRVGGRSFTLRALSRLLRISKNGDPLDEVHGEQTLLPPGFQRR
jgi:hypothetical protein